MNALYLLAGVVMGAASVFLYLRTKLQMHKNEISHKEMLFEKQKNEALHQMQIDKALDKSNIENLTHQIQKLSSKLLEKESLLEETMNGKKVLEVENRSMADKLAMQSEEIEKLNEKFNKEFQLIASKILKENSKDITEIHHKNIADLLGPFKEKLASFEKKIQDTYEKELRDKVDLKAELKSLHELNKRISEEANNLTKALKGDSKKQGNWGEVILERVLERSGLTKGQEYLMQFSTQNEEGKRIQPDVLVLLPDKKNIIIDAKVSLVAYEKFVNAADENERHQYLKEHLTSVKAHINSLSDKKYHEAADIISPEFVLMFMPIEASFSTAIQADVEIFSYAWDRKIVVVSPTTLLATLRTISSIWKQEYQTKNAIEIARQGGNLYDKFVGFVEDMDKLSKHIEMLSKTHNEALKKLSSGAGNLIKRAEDLRELGVKTSKALPEKFIEDDNAASL